MDFIFGCWSQRSSNVDCRTVVERMKGFFVGQHVPHLLFPLGPNFAAGVASFVTPPGSLGKAMVETDEVIAVGDVTLYDEASVDSNGKVRTTPAEELLRVAKVRDDESGLAALNGDFAVAAYDKRTEALTLIRDPCGILPLHYSQHGQACAFSALVRPLLLTPWALEALDEIGLAAYLVVGAPGLERTCFRSVKSVLPASRVVLRGTRDAAISRKYWLPTPDWRHGGPRPRKR